MNDAELIDKLGGPSRLAEILGFDREGGAQRVHNWKERGIPAKVKLMRPDLFIPGFGAAATKRDKTPA